MIDDGDKILDAYIRAQLAREPARAPILAGVTAWEPPTTPFDWEQIEGRTERNPTMKKRVGAIIRARRRVQEISQEDLAKKAGSTAPVLINIEKGRWKPFETLEAICKELGLRIELVDTES